VRYAKENILKIKFNALYSIAIIKTIIKPSIWIFNIALNEFLTVDFSICAFLSSSVFERLLRTHHPIITKTKLKINGIHHLPLIKKSSSFKVSKAVAQI